MCFRVETTDIFESIEQFFVDLISFLKISLVLSVVNIIKMIRVRAQNYIDMFASVPEEMLLSSQLMANL